MALNPDALNLNYDSDDSMQVDSDSDHPPQHTPSIHPPPDPDADADADPDADAEGDAEYVDDTTSAILENPVAGPSTYPHKDYVSRPSVTLFRPNPRRSPQGCGRLGMSLSCVLISLDRIPSPRAMKTVLKTTRMTRTRTMLPMQMTSMARRRLLGKRRRRHLQPRPLLGRRVRPSPSVAALPIDNQPKQLYAMPHQIQTLIMARDQRKRRRLACPATRYVSPVEATRFPIITRITRTLQCSRRRRLPRHIMSTPRSPKKTMRSKPS